MNPFKFGTIVEGRFFTDRKEKLAEIEAVMSSANHLVIISPRRYGKSSLVKKAVSEMKRPCISINLQSVTSVEDLSRKILAGIFRIKPIERLKKELSSFRFVPTVSFDPLSERVDVSFVPTADSSVVLEDSLLLLDKVSGANKRVIVVFDEFQEVLEIERNLDKKLRSVFQDMQNVNLVFLGSQESMMTEIFERKKSPFYHFGEVVHLPKLPYDEFREYLSSGLKEVSPARSGFWAERILDFTGCHPYYGQQLAFHLWEYLGNHEESEESFNIVVKHIVESRDLDFTRLWDTLPRTDRYVMQSLARGINPQKERTLAPSTVSSSYKRLCQKGFLVRQTSGYEIEDPFFRLWILSMQVI